jgi:hypothetical protein
MKLAGTKANIGLIEQKMPRRTILAGRNGLPFEPDILGRH